MGADGGEIYCKISDMKKFQLLAKAWLYRFENRSSWASKHAYDYEEYVPSSPDVYMIGYYGTDCESSMEALFDVTSWILECSDERYRNPIDKFDWNRSFEEVWLDLQTMPVSYPDHSFVKDIFKEVYFSEYGAQQEFPDSPTVYQWAKSLRRICGSFFYHETWT